MVWEQTVDLATPRDEDPTCYIDEELWCLCLRCGQWYHIDDYHGNVRFGGTCDGRQLRLVADTRKNLRATTLYGEER
jgi:hypothetical protein